MNRFIIADPKKCIGCHTCEVACVVSHQQASQDNLAIDQISEQNFQPRIHVVKGFSISTAVVCHQCEDTPCANVCPNGAIIHNKDYYYVDQDKCIGCKTCVLACPYGTMEVVSRPVMRKLTALNTIEAFKAEANKCDLCHHRAEGPACVEVCPTQALVCIDRDALEDMVKERRRKAAFETGADLLF
ncbi:TPA: electron transport protein HydN [Proteus mirabilis]